MRMCHNARLPHLAHEINALYTLSLPYYDLFMLARSAPVYNIFNSMHAGCYVMEDN